MVAYYNDLFVYRLMRYEALRSRFHFVFIHFNSTSSGGQIDAGVNAQLFCKTRLRVMGSSPASQGLFGNGNLQIGKE